MNTLFDGIYVAGTLKELQYRGIKVEPGLTADELRAVERAVGAPLPPDLALLLRAGLPSGEDFPDWRADPEGEMRRAREWMARAFTFDLEAAQWWFDGWGARPVETNAAKHLALEHLSAASPLVPIYSHRFIPTDPPAFGNPVLSVWQAGDSIYYGFDLAHYLHHEFGVPRPPWSARIPPRVPFWGDVFGLLDEDQASGPSDNGRTDIGREWHASLSIVGPYPPDTLSTALGIQPSHIDTDTEGADSEREDGEWEASPLYTWTVDSRLPIVPTAGILTLNSLEEHILDVLQQLAGSWMRMVEVSGWPEVDIVFSATLPLINETGDEDGSDEDREPPGRPEAFFELDPEALASLSQIKARLEVTFR